MAIKKKNVDVKETYRQGLLLGMGLASLSKKAIGAYINNVVKENKLNTKDGEKLVKSVMARTNKVTKVITKKLQGNLKAKLSTGLNLSRTGLQTLDNTLGAIEKQLQAKPKGKKRR